MSELNQGWNPGVGEYDLLTHSFYRRWVEGTLTRPELIDYSSQYAHVVAALPRWLDSHGLSDHADEERAHQRLWQEFALAVGADAGSFPQPANPTTRRLLDAGEALAEAGHGAAAAWAVESQAAPVAASKLTGLKQHYAIDGSNGGRYFVLHAHRDLEHTAELEEILTQRAAPGDLAAARTIQAGMWELLTSVERQPSPPGAS